MRNFLGHLLILVSPCFLFGQTNDASSVDTSGEEPLPFLNADFFADSLSEAYTLEEDPMGAQRLLQVRNSTLSPSVQFLSNLAHNSNHMGVSESQLDKNKAEGKISDAFSYNLSLILSLGMGEYGLGDDVISTPNISFSRSRSFVDPFRDYGDQYATSSQMNSDSLGLNLSVPFRLPNDFGLDFAHSYNSIHTYRGKPEQVMYVNVPSITFSKLFILDNGDTINFTTGVSYTLSKSPTEEEILNSGDLGISSEFLKQIFLASNPGKSLSELQHTNNSDNLNHKILLSYSRKIGENMVISPSISYDRPNFTSGIYKARSAETLTYDLSFSFFPYEWLSISTNTTFTKQKTSGTDSDEEFSFENFSNIIGLTINHSF